MGTAATRDLRNHTNQVLSQVAQGERVTITRDGVPVAEIVPVDSVRPMWLTRDAFARRIANVQADAELRSDLALLAGDTTDDLGPVP